MIISVGYRVKSPRGIAFRKWATLYCFLLFSLDMSINIILYKWHKIKVFVIDFISVYPIFCKHNASMKQIKIQIRYILMKSYSTLLSFIEINSLIISIERFNSERLNLLFSTFSG